MSNTNKREKNLNRIAIALSIAIPLIVVVLFQVKIEGLNFSFLPPIYAGINLFTAIVLVSAVIAIKNGDRKAHENLMKLAIGLSTAFLLLYVLYHISTDHTEFGGENWVKPIYFTLLFSHIGLSVAVVPMVLFTLIRALLGKFSLHKKLAKITFPIWLYVAISGVIVYLMIRPYYVQ